MLQGVSGKKFSVGWNNIVEPYRMIHFRLNSYTRTVQYNIVDEVDTHAWKDALEIKCLKFEVWMKKQNCSEYNKFGKV